MIDPNGRTYYGSHYVFTAVDCDGVRSTVEFDAETMGMVLHSIERFLQAAGFVLQGHLEDVLNDDDPRLADGATA